MQGRKKVGGVPRPPMSRSAYFFFGGGGGGVGRYCTGGTGVTPRPSFSRSMRGGGGGFFGSPMVSPGNHFLAGGGGGGSGRCCSGGGGAGFRPASVNLPVPGCDVALLSAIRVLL